MNKVIIIGYNHHNTLGVVRSFGENNVRPYGIIVNQINKKGFVFKSKYWEKTYIAKDEADALILLKTEFSAECEKPVVIVTGDSMMEMLDIHRDELSPMFILPGFPEEQGAVSRLMDKDAQVSFARANGIYMLNSENISLSDTDITIHCEYPVILKPVASNDGVKFDITICNSIEEFAEAIQQLRSKGYQRILVQHYLKDKEEFVLTGSVEPKTALITFAVVKHIRQWPPKIGTGSYSQFIHESDIQAYCHEVLRKLMLNGYSGPIDLELFRSEDGRLILNEFNWRVSGRNFVSSYTGVHSTFLWYLAVTDQKLESFPLIASSDGYSMNDVTDIRHMLRGTITFKQWIRDLQKAKSFSIWNTKDFKPVVSRYTYILFEFLKHRSLH